GYLYRGATAPDGAVYALEGGQALRSYAPIVEGLRTLHMVTQVVELSEASQWLRGSSWQQPDAARRAQLDVWLRCVVPPRLNARQLLDTLLSAPPDLRDN